jgi:hypothetical protein
MTSAFVYLVLSLVILQRAIAAKRIGASFDRRHSQTMCYSYLSAVADEGPYTVLVRFDDDPNPPQDMSVPQFLPLGLRNATLFVYDRFGRFNSTTTEVNVVATYRPCVVSLEDTNATWNNCTPTLAFGASCNVSCLPGYQPVGETQLTCNSTGTNITVLPGLCACMFVYLRAANLMPASGPGGMYSPSATVAHRTKMLTSQTVEPNDLGRG